MKKYSLPELPYGFKDLEPSISEEQLKIHYEKHHQAYVNGANDLMDKIDKSRKDGLDYDHKSVSKALAFNIGGFVLHSLFWENLKPEKEEKGDFQDLKTMVEETFGSMDRFKDEFTKVAMSVEGSGWAALVYSKDSGNLMLMQIEKHSVNIYPEHRILLVLDMFEHAYYLDYKNDKAKYVEAFWNILNWNEVNKRLVEARS